MTAHKRYYDVYVSYPPGENPERVNACLRDNLSDEEANDIINALAEQRQAIIAEHCTNEERQNAQHYFSYLGLDVIVRLSLEFAEDAPGKNRLENDIDTLADPVPQCPVCYTILEDASVRDCPTCGLHLDNISETQIQRKRIEWQERIAFEHRKKHEIAYKLLREKQEEEKQLRKQIRAELEEQLMVELGQLQGWRKWFHGKYLVLTGILLIGLITIVLAIGYMISQLFFSGNDNAVTSTTLSAPVSTVSPAASSTTVPQSVSGAQQPAAQTTTSSSQTVATTPPANVESTASATRPASQPPHDLPEVSVPATQPMDSSKQ